jgi:lysozyme family protein/peptidoglycan hydrolase-like protein with peptidoglycan-binding domain
MNLTPALTKEYSDLWASCTIRTARIAEVDAIVDRIVRNKQRYTAVGKPLGVTWHVVGIIHMLEGSGNFATHLHNGDPLTARTVHVPRGRPKQGRPPFTWEESASDALIQEGLDRWNNWTVPGTLFVLEGFNGFGYHGKGINSPYLWSFSNHYAKGKFSSDGVFSATAVSAQCGAAVLLSRMLARHLTKVAGVAQGPGLAQPVGDGILRQGEKGPAVRKVKVLLKRWFDATSPGEWATLKVADNDVFGVQLVAAVRIFQTRLNLDVDGKVGTHTMGALKAKPKLPTPTMMPDLIFPGALKRGSTGEKVRLLQGWLTLHDSKGPIDSTFQPATEKALKVFQAKQGLPATGVVDPATWKALVQPMVAALTRIPQHGALGPLVVAYAQQHLKQRPLEAGGDNRGPWVRLYTNQREGEPWCAGFATFCLKQACETLGLPMPVKQTLACDEMATSTGHRFMKGATAGAIGRLTPGSFFLRRGKPSDTFKYAHCGIIVSAGAETMQTISGNTNDDGSSNGIAVLSETRHYPGMDFIVL